MPASGHSRPAMLPHLWQAISNTFKAFTEGAAAARRASRTYDQLASMSDPELHDIGIHRSDIPAVVSGTYRWARWPSPDGV
jgi:uncharacterized protein YjiS (DUF1127 family)